MLENVRILVASDSNGIAKMGENARLDSDSTGGTSTVSTARENPPVVVSPQNTPHYIDTDELLEMFFERGFEDAHSNAAQQLFKRASYQHLNPYIKAVESCGTVTPAFKCVHDLLTLDRRFQSSVFKYIGMFETQFRASYANSMALEHGPFALYDPNLFLREGIYKTSMSIYEGEVARKARHSYSTRYALEHYEGKLPIWLAVELMTLGTISKLFSNTGDKAVTQAVLSSFGIKKRVFSSWLKTITEARNAFAHFDPYLVRRQIPSIPLGIREISLPNTSPLYIVPLLYHLLDAPTTTSDPNTRYSELLREDTLSVLIPFFETYEGTGLIPGVPDNWRETLSFWDMPPS